jgi:hypothetical protein
MLTFRANPAYLTGEAGMRLVMRDDPELTNWTKARLNGSRAVNNSSLTSPGAMQERQLTWACIGRRTLFTGADCTAAPPLGFPAISAATCALAGRAIGLIAATGTAAGLYEYASLPGISNARSCRDESTRSMTGTVQNRNIWVQVSCHGTPVVSRIFGYLGMSSGRGVPQMSNGVIAEGLTGCQR